MSKRKESKEPAVDEARVKRQDATGIDVPAGSSRKDVAPEEYRPTIDTGGAPPGEREKP